MPFRFFLDLASVTMNGVTPVTAYFSIVKNFRLIWSHRMEVQSKTRRKSDEEVMKIAIMKPSPILHYLKGYRTWREFLDINPRMLKPLQKKVIQEKMELTLLKEVG
jgi:hypothetical protein